MQVTLTTNYAQRQNFGSLSTELQNTARLATKKAKGSKALRKVIDEINNLTEGKVVYLADNFDSDNVHGFRQWVCVKKEGLMRSLFGGETLGKSLEHDSSEPIKLFKEILRKIKKHC